MIILNILYHNDKLNHHALHAPPRPAPRRQQCSSKSKVASGACCAGTAAEMRGGEGRCVRCSEHSSSNKQQQTKAVVGDTSMAYLFVEILLVFTQVLTYYLHRTVYKNTLQKIFIVTYDN